LVLRAAKALQDGYPLLRPDVDQFE
jgi:hypothetical protein